MARSSRECARSRAGYSSATVAHCCTAPRPTGRPPCECIRPPPSPRPSHSGSALDGSERPIGGPRAGEQPLPQPPAPVPVPPPTPLTLNAPAPCCTAGTLPRQVRGAAGRAHVHGGNRRPPLPAHSTLSSALWAFAHRLVTAAATSQPRGGARCSRQPQIGCRRRGGTRPPPAASGAEGGAPAAFRAPIAFL